MNDGKEDVGTKPSNQNSEHFVVGVSDAVVEPVAMVVKPLTASVADAAVLCLMSNVFIAHSAEQFELASLALWIIRVKLLQLTFSF